MADKFIERKILIGFITSTKYLKEVRQFYKSQYLKSAAAKRIAVWCLEYFEKYEKAPGQNIETIFLKKMKNGLSEDIGEEIEQDILPELSEEYVEDGIDVEYLLDESWEYFEERHLEIFEEQLADLRSQGETRDAEKLIAEFRPLSKDPDDAMDFSDESSLEVISQAFAEAADPLISYPHSLGHFWNDQFVRGGFISLMGREKLGKSFWLMDMAVRAVKQKRKVAFFQAGDMSREKQTLRFCVRLAKKSNQGKYAGTFFHPVPDCVKNQTDTCNHPDRESAFGIFPDKTVKEIRAGLEVDELKQAWEEYHEEYSPCHNCSEYLTHKWGVPWLKKVNVGNPLTENEAKTHFSSFFLKKKQSIRLSTHPNLTLSIRHIKMILDGWEEKYNFIPDIIIIDYADLLIAEKGQDERAAQNEIWKGLRNLSQVPRGGNLPLVITVTQTDANSYDQKLLKLKNFSEDKRKYSHVTAKYGLNQDPEGREKGIGVMRINAMVLREGDFNNTEVVYVLQSIRQGLPCVGSFY